MTDSYIIQAGDELYVKLYTRDGSSLIENIEKSNQIRQIETYLVQQNGMVKLPIVGDLFVVGKTENDLRQILESKLSRFYNSPYSIVKVTNRRAFVFIGESSFLVELNRSPTNIFEVISKTGVFKRQISTKDVIIYRNNDSSRIQKLDLSSIQSISNADIIIQPNDIVYIPEKNRKLYHGVRDLSPVVTLPLSIITSTVSIVVLVLSLSK